MCLHFTILFLRTFDFCVSCRMQRVNSRNDIHKRLTKHYKVNVSINGQCDTVFIASQFRTWRTKENEWAREREKWVVIKNKHILVNLMICAKDIKPYDATSRKRARENSTRVVDCFVCTFLRTLFQKQNEYAYEMGKKKEEWDEVVEAKWKEKKDCSVRVGVRDKKKTIKNT